VPPGRVAATQPAKLAAFPTASIAESAPLVPGESYVVDWDLQPIDHVFPVGHKIGLVLLANDKNYAAADPLAGGVSVELDKTSFVLPVAP